MSDLDDRIRDLVARAAADAPPPPAIDETTALTRGAVDGQRRPGARRVVGGLAGLSAAAALVALFWIGSDDLAEEPTIPLGPSTAESTLPSATPTTAPTATTPATAVDEVPTPTDPPPSTTTTAPVGDTRDGDVVRAGPDGVVVAAPDGSTRAITDEPMAVAFGVPDGRVFMQRGSDNRDPDADTSILVAEPQATELIGQPMPTPELADAPLRLHDVAVVGGEVVLLIESGPGRCAGFEDCDGSLWALHADSGDLDLILTQSMWEAGFGQVHLANNGLIVGERFAEVLSMPYSAVVPGSDVAPIDFAELGLDDQYADCSICPTAFSIDRSGTTVAWLEWNPDAYVVAVGAADGSAVERFTVIDQRTDYIGDGFAPNPWLELADPSARSLFVNAQTWTGTDQVAPSAIDLDAGVMGSTGLAPGTVVTAG